MERVADVYRAMITDTGRTDCEAPGLTVERRGRRARAIRPLAFGVRHEADAIGALTVIEAGNAHLAALVGKHRLDGNVAKRIARARPREARFETAPLLDRSSWHLVLRASVGARQQQRLVGSGRNPQ